MVVRVTRHYPIIFEIMDGQGNNIVYYNLPDNNYSGCNPTDYNNITYDPLHGVPNDDNSVADDATDDLNDDDPSITINPNCADQHGPIAGVETNHNNLY